VDRKTTLILLLLLLAFGLRAWGAADHNIWWDEGVSVWAARLPVSTILRWTAQDVHPPLYYLLLRGWWLLVGSGEFVLRFPSVLASTLGVAVIYGLGRALGGRRAGLLTALLFTLSRFAVAWSQEVRMYSVATTLAAGALWASVRLYRGAGWRAWTGYVLTAAGGLLSIYLAASVPLIAGLAFPLAWLRSGRPRRVLAAWVSAQLAVAALVAPWLLYALPRMHGWSSTEAFTPALFLHLYATILTVGTSVNLEAYTPLTAAVLCLLGVGLVALWRGRRSAVQTAGLAMLLLGLVLPALLVYAVTIPGNPLYARPLVPRYLLPLSACYYTLLGWGLGALARKRPWPGRVGTALAVVAALIGLSSFYPGRARQDSYVSLAATLRAYRHPGDTVILHTDRDWPILAAHYDGTWQGVPYGAPMDGPRADALLTPLWEQAEGVWLVTTPDAQRADPQQAVRAWLEGRAAASSRWSFGRNALSLYARTPQRAETLRSLAPGFRPPDGPHVSSASGAVLQGAWVPLPRYLTGDTVRLFLYWTHPPQEDVFAQMAGAVDREVTAHPPVPARAGPTLQQVDLPLGPDLPGARYRLLLRVGEEPLAEVGHFTLVQREPGTTSPPDAIPHPLGLRLGQSIQLLGYDLPVAVVEPGGVVELTLYWQTSRPVPDRYKVFTHLLGETWNAAGENFLWGQVDSEPASGQARTTLWTPGVTVVDPYEIPVAADAPPGLYALEIGMYGLVDGTRLPIYDGEGRSLGDAILLGQVEVQAP
jgi:mannosyltransferase